MRVKPFSIFLQFAAYSWMLLNTVSFFVTHKPLFLSTLIKQEMAVKHCWGEEQQVEGYLFYNIGRRPSHPSEQSKGVYGTLTKQKCMVCGAVRDKEKFCGALRIDWSDLWERDTTNLLACPLKSNNVTYRETFGCSIEFEQNGIRYEVGRQGPRYNGP
jgi:hypothetical protein